MCVCDNLTGRKGEFCMENTSQAASTKSGLQNGNNNDNNEAMGIDIYHS